MEEILNKCFFIGIVKDAPKLEKLDGVSYISFDLEIVEHRRSKNGDKVKTVTYLPFEAYHTGAEVIAELCTPGAKITVQCSARTWKDPEGYESVIFRVNEFDFC